MKNINLAIDIKTSNYVIPKKSDLENEELVDSLLLRSDFDSINDFIGAHERMNKNKNNE